MWRAACFCALRFFNLSELERRALARSPLTLERLFITFSVGSGLRQQVLTTRVKVGFGSNSELACCAGLSPFIPQFRPDVPFRANMHYAFSAPVTEHR